MAPRKTKKAKTPNLDIFAKYAKEFGIQLEVDSVKEEYEKKSHDAGDGDPLSRRLSATGMLWRIENLGYRGEFITKKCRRPECGLTFQTNYKADAYCSYDCTERDLWDRFGIKYDTTRSIEDRWGWKRERFNVPLKISPSGLKALEEFAINFLKDLEEFRERQKVLGKNPSAATRYLWSDRGLSEEALDEFYPLPEKQEVPSEPEQESAQPIPSETTSPVVEDRKTDSPNPEPQRSETKGQFSLPEVDLFGDLLS